MGIERLPIFPLPDVVLFPHSILPLHVFEPRYREMTRDVMAGDGLLCIVRLRPGFERDYQGRPPVFDVAGLGEIIEHQGLEGGRCNIFVRGLARLHIERELAPAHAYRLVCARRLFDEYSGNDLGIAASGLRTMAQQLAAVLPQGGETLRAILEGAADPGALSDVLAASVIVDPEERQQLMETLEVGERLTRMSAAVAVLLRRLQKPVPNPLN